MLLCTRRPGCQKLDGHGDSCGTWDAKTQGWKPLPPTEAERRHGEAVRRETARQERRQERAQHIARNTPLPATWRASVEMTTVLQAEIVAYGAACARWAMNEQEKEA